MFTVNPQVTEEPQTLGIRLMCVLEGFENDPEVYVKTESGWQLTTDENEVLSFETLREEFDSVSVELNEV